MNTEPEGVCPEPVKDYWWEVPVLLAALALSLVWGSFLVWLGYKLLIWLM